jgi:hypothetical protein
MIEDAKAHELPVGDSRQCEASIERGSAVWRRNRHPVRAALPLRMPNAARRCFAMTVAQSGRAANL